MGKNSHVSNAPLTGNHNKTTSDDARDGRRPADKPQTTGSTPGEHDKRAHDEQNKATVEEFGREGLGVAAKE